MLETSRFKQVFLATLFIWASGCSFACGNPGEVSEAYYSAITNGDFATSAKMFHPDGVSSLRSRLDFMYESDDESVNNFWPMFGEDADPATVKAMTDQEFFEVLHVLVTEKSTAGELMRLDAYEVVGTVMEDDETAHVLVRVHTTLTMEGKENFYAKNKADVYFDVQSMRCRNGEWMIEKDDGVDGLVFALEAHRDLLEQRKASAANASKKN